MGTLAPLDDRISPAIQMGDLLANTVKRTFEDSMHNPAPALEVLKGICGRTLYWVAAFDEDYMRALREASLDAATAPQFAFEYKDGN